MLNNRSFRYLGFLLMLSLVTACSGQPATPTAPQRPPEERQTVHIAALRGSTAMGMVRLMDEASQDRTAVDYQVSVVGAADEISAALIKGDLDIAAIPANLAALLWNRTGGEVTVLAVNTLGVLYLVERGDSISQLSDLRGMTIHSTGKGTTPEYLFDYLLQANGIASSEVTVEYRTEAAELAMLLAEGSASVALLPEPYVTTVLASDPELRIALDLNAEWEKLGQEPLLTAVTVARTAWLAEHPNEIALFLGDYQASIEYARRHILETAALIERFEIMPSAALAEKALPNCNITYLGGQEMREALSAYLTILYEANPNVVGGALPDETFYYMNP